MANPRKFSEKIAIQIHRQEEETARFNEILREVRQVSVPPGRVAPKENSSNSKQNTLRINTQALGTFRGGSLPNVSADSVKTPPVPPAKLSEIEIVKPNEDVRPPRASSFHNSRARNQGGPIRRPHERRLDTSPYSSGTFLSPPPDTSWRRTNSDSALHQSAMQGMNSDRNDSSSRMWMGNSMNGPDRNDGRPKSSCEVPRVPGIHIYPSAHEPGMIQIPIGNNTGSLPDLTNVDFSSPIHAPLDQDHGGSSPYSSSPVNTSPSTLSPTSIPQGVRPPGRFHFTSVSQAHSNIQLDKNLFDGSEFNHLIYQQCSPSTSPTLHQAAGYRSPRPSPQSSPSLGGRHSAPCSPGAPSPLPNEFNIFNPTPNCVIQQQMDQLSMLDTPASSMSYGDPTDSLMHSQMMPEGSSMGNIELTNDAYNTSPSHMVYSNHSPNIHTPQTPNTPTSIPNIILTMDDMSRQELTRFDANELFENSIRDDLGSLDFEGFAMLANQSISVPESLEDNFRS
ncbi:unnamed protein product [Brassicogethes aeneus]|uniref:CREB-regulated transcription coactivator 1 n=1 Tax=Brassicogethes aeneus TaxID=1431903 RepID=A0A9P0FCE2_BRAAE|nr:unnamed protein product [Brassicogethes aeneus]